MHWHEVTPNIKNPTGYFLDHFFLDALASLELDVTLTRQGFFRELSSSGHEVKETFRQQDKRTIG